MIISQSNAQWTQQRSVGLGQLEVIPLCQYSILAQEHKVLKAFTPIKEEGFVFMFPDYDTASEYSTGSVSKNKDLS
jgi:hypothetical protein